MRLPVKEPIDVDQLNLDIDVTSEAYIALATKLGITCLPEQRLVTREKFLAQLAENRIPIYPMDRVNAYMDRMCTKALHNWHWEPLRSKDVGTCKHFSYQRACKKVWKDSRYNLQFGAVINDKSPVGVTPIPFSVLMRIDDIQEAIPDAHFYVTETKQAAGDKFWRDPFLAVTLDGLNELFVVEHWDEPDFEL